MLRPRVACVLLVLSLSACDFVDERPDFVPGEVIVSLKAGVEPDAFLAYVEADPALTWKGVFAETVGPFVLVGVTEGMEEATAARLEAEAGEFVAHADVNRYAYLN